MKLISFACVASALLLSTLLGCSVGSAEAPTPDDLDNIGAADDEIQSSRLLGKYEWRSSEAFLDMTELTLQAGGKYTARATDPRILCNRFPCTISEEGTWSSHKNGGKDKLRLMPDEKPVRIYTFRRSSTDSSLTLERGEASTKLFKIARAAACRKTGCSGQICADEEVGSRCNWEPKYACYRSASCERQPNGDCAFTSTPQLDSCLAANP